MYVLTTQLRIFYKRAHNSKTVTARYKMIVYYRDIKKNGLSEQLTLKDSYNYDSVLCGCVADVDFDGLNEIILGTFGQVCL